METNREEALKAKEIAEKRFSERDFAGAKNYASKAKTLFPAMEGISQMVATFDVYSASEAKFNGEVDYYSVLGLKPFADKDAVKKQYRKMAVLLHPDKNKCVGADGAFKLVSEAWTMLSDKAKKKSYDHHRSNQTNASSASKLDTFWTVCTSCKVQYEYLRKYVNKRLSCKNCRGVFIAVETGTAPANGSFPYTPWSYVPNPNNGYGSHGSYDGVAYVPSNTIFAGNGVSGYHSGHNNYEYVSNVSFQWSGTSVAAVGPTAPSHHSHGDVKSRSNGKRSGPPVNSHQPANELPGSNSKIIRPDKRRKVVVDSEFRNGYLENEPKAASEMKLENGNAGFVPDHRVVNNFGEIPVKRCSAAPAFDARKLLVDKARTAILKKLGEMKLQSVVVDTKKVNPESGQHLKFKEANKRIVNSENQIPVSITVPDPDFHDFDKDRSEECFKPKQIWALYDEEDGMPRLYCLIREVISVKPFKILITYLNSKTDTEFGAVNWLYYGFTKSCGNFRAWSSDVVDKVNVFSHVLAHEKAGRGGCVRLYPRVGDVWAVYRNWSTEWDRSTPEEVRRRYEMVEVIDEYGEEGVCVIPLVKVAGFKTVYGRSPEKAASRWIPRPEMLRFSHRVPAYLLRQEESGSPEKCWDLDPAATPDDLLHAPAD